MLPECLLAFNPYYNCASSLVLSFQIIANAREMGSVDRPQYLVAVCFLVHNLLVVYYSLVDNNLLRMQPVPWAGYFVLVVTVGQLVILALQEC